MHRLILASALLSGGMLFFPTHSYAHGGTYRGPGDLVPPAAGGAGGRGPGPSVPGPNGPSSEGPGKRSGGPGNVPGSFVPGDPSSGLGAASTDLSKWEFWWEFNKSSYLNTKSHVNAGVVSTGSDIHDLGRGEVLLKNTLAPTKHQIQQKIVPALIEVLKHEDNNDIVTGALIALAKIGDVRSENGASEFEELMSSFLSNANIEISETAAVSLGILANPSSIPVLENLLMDTSLARAKLVKRSEVPYRIRAFAAYGLGLIGSSSIEDAHKRQIIDILARAIDSDDTRSRDIQVACIISLGLTPISEIDADEASGRKLQASDCRAGQLQYLFDYMNDKKNAGIARAHCPGALARLAGQSSLNPTLGAWREKLAKDFERLATGQHAEPNELIQSAVIGLGLLGDNSSQGLGAVARKAILTIPTSVKDQQARNFSMIATAQAGGTSVDADPESGILEASGFLSQHLRRGKESLKPWAGLALGVMSEKLAKEGNQQYLMEDAAKALRQELASESNPSRLGAYAIAAGLMRDLDSETVLLGRLDKLNESEVRGYICLSLALMGSALAKEPLRELVAQSEYKPELLRQAAIALGLLGDKDVVPMLIEMLNRSSSLSTQASLAAALGSIGDQRSVDPLVDMLLNQDLLDSVRGFAAVALGIVGDQNLEPWNAKIAADINYRAATGTLADSAGGTGILDIL